MKKLLVLGPQEIQTGLWKIGKAAGLLWEEGNNVVFKDNGFRRSGGALQQGTSLNDQARDIAQAYISGTGAKRIYFGTDTDMELYELLAGVWTKSVLHTWATAGQYADLETWGTWLVGTNGVNPVQVWKNTGVAAALAGVPFSKARVLKRKTPFLIAMNTNNIGDTGIEWSSDSDIEAWTPTLANKAGNYNLRDMDSEILAAEDLGDRVALYSRNSMGVGTFTGGGNVWNWKRVLSGIGAVSRRSVVSLDPFNYGLMQGGVFKTDGNSFAWVDEPAMQKYIKDTADWTKAALFWGFSDAILKTVNFSFLNSDDDWLQVVYYPDNNLWTKGSAQITAGARKEVFGYPIIATEDLQVGTWQESSQFFSLDIPYSLKTKPLDFGERSIYKLLQLIRVDGQWTAGRIRVQELQHPEDTAPKTIIDRDLQRENYFEREGRYFTLEFYGDKPLYVTGIEFFGEPGGVAL